MAIAKLSEIVGRLSHRLPEPNSSVSDSELLARFLHDRNEEAFAQIVHRHGPLVFGVCRRVTGNHHLAEDSFQAVFVVLAAKAGSIRPPAALSAWLYGVAHRIALRARTMADRRRRREVLVESLPDVAAPPENPADDADLAALLDAEIARLPEHLRMAVLACEIEGLSRSEAAARLQIPEGTLSSRLAAARKALANRLRGRGIVLSAAALTAAFERVASASVPPLLVGKAVAAAFAPGAASAAVASLSHGVLRIMFVEKLRSVPLALGLLASVAFAGHWLFATQPESPVRVPSRIVAAPPVEPKRAAEKPAPPAPNRILFYRAGKLTLLDPDGKNEKELSKESLEIQPGAMLSPDGKLLALCYHTGTPGRWKLHVRGIEAKAPGTDLGVECYSFVWSTDGTEIAYSCYAGDGEGDAVSATHGIVNVNTKKTSPLRLPESHTITDWSRDGKHFLTQSMEIVNPRKWSQTIWKLHLMNRDGTEHKALTDGKQAALYGRLSPDGTRVLYLEGEGLDDNSFKQHGMKVLDVATGKLVSVEDVPLNAELWGYSWSPDGKRIAYAWRAAWEGKAEDRVNKETESILMVSDWDGKNAKTIATVKGTFQIGVVGALTHPDWR